MKQQWLVVRSRWHPFTWKMRARVPLVLGILIVLIVLVLIINFAIGELFVPIDAIIPTIWNGIMQDKAAQAAQFGSVGRRYTFVIMTLLMPRLLVAVLVGVALGVSGSILQGLTRNPLASPDIIGVTQGASLAAVGMLILASWISLEFLPIFAFCGAALAVLVMYLLAWKGDGTSPVRLVLIGIGLSALCYAFVQVFISNANLIRVSQAMTWFVGSVYGRTWDHLTAFLPWICIFVPLSFFLSRHLDAFFLGEDIARGLGVRVEWQRALLLISCVALAGSAVATAGTIGFVALVAPHIARLLVGPSHNGVIPVSALLGGLIVLIADTFGRLLFAPIDIPCGVITAIVGAPYLIWLLVRSRTV